MVIRHICVATNQFIYKNRIKINMNIENKCKFMKNKTDCAHVSIICHCNCDVIEKSFHRILVFQVHIGPN